MLSVDDLTAIVLGDDSMFGLQGANIFQIGEFIDYETIMVVHSLPRFAGAGNGEDSVRRRLAHTPFCAGIRIAKFG